MSFADSVISNNEHMMALLADVNEKSDMHAEIDKLDEAGFKQTLQEMSGEALCFLGATFRANGDVPGLTTLLFKATEVANRKRTEELARGCRCALSAAGV